MKIYHNPRCSKSRQTLQLILDAGKKVEVVEYLKDVPDEVELRNIVALLGIPAEQLLRKSEQIFKEKFKGKILADDEWIKVMSEHPVLIERPIVIDGKRAILGRPPENVLKLL
jgi:arsenate reductase (glutaredoxin)